MEKKLYKVFAKVLFLLSGCFLCLAAIAVYDKILDKMPFREGDFSTLLLINSFLCIALFIGALFLMRCGRG